MFIVTVVAWVVLSFATNGGAQTNTGEIQGVVRDPLGGALPGATIVALHAVAGLRVERVSDESGRFFMPGLPVGDYGITVTLEGFKAVNRGLTLQVGQRLDVPVTLP